MSVFYPLEAVMQSGWMQPSKKIAFQMKRIAPDPHNNCGKTVDRTDLSQPKIT
jgi:hypothetical protein